MTTPPITAPKKLIEVALPLDEINKAAAREKSIRHGHPSTIHLWWARRPLAVARAVLFAQLVNDPAWKYSDEEFKKPQVKAAITKKRKELFRLVTDLVQWESTAKEDVLQRARREIRASWRETCEANKHHPEAPKLFNANELPPFFDPFAGGGSLPLEAQRLGLRAFATDLNPVSVLINKAMIEIPSRLGGRSPVGPVPASEKQVKTKATEDWSGTRGLAEDVRRYGAWMRDKAESGIGHLYPKVEVTAETAKARPDLRPLVGHKLTVIAWLWARSVKSPNPAFADANVPLASTFLLASKQGKEAWAEPVADGKRVHFVVRTGKPPAKAANGTKGSGRGAEFRCVLSGAPITGDYIKAQGQDGKLGTQLMSIVAEGERTRVYLSPTADAEHVADSARPTWRPTGDVPSRLTGGTCVPYGLSEWWKLFTPRQLVALTTFSDLVQGVAAKCRADAAAAGVPDDDIPLHAGGTGARAYGEAVATYLAMVVDKEAETLSTICIWSPAPKNELIMGTFRRQALPMTWDFAEANPFAHSTGSFEKNVHVVARALELSCVVGSDAAGSARQHEATETYEPARDLAPIVSTDPPYYDNISYADLADYLYVWLRRSLKPIFPDLFATLAVPKAEELVATAHRHGSRDAADQFFLNGMTRALCRIAESARPTLPVTVYYAFKQSDTSDSEGTVSTGWETFLQALFNAGFGLTGTWPMRTERDFGVKTGSNVLASSVILVCRQRSKNLATTSRKEFLRLLSRTLPVSLTEMTSDPSAAIAPVDLAQAAIGPGMAIFSQFSAVLEADGRPMTVRNALIHINKTIDNYFAEAEGELDADSRFCLGWFQQYGFLPGSFGEADVLARAKGTSVDGVKQAGVLAAGKGKVHLLRVGEYPAVWDPRADSRLPIWEACHQMCRALSESEGAAGALLARMPEKQDAIRQLAYRLYTICERKGWAEEARAYNELVMSWPAIVEESVKAGVKGSQLTLI